MKSFISADITAAADLALVYGLLQRSGTGDLTHCPLMLTPTPIKGQLIEQLQSLSAPTGWLIHQVANNLDFLVEQLQPVIETDEYTRFLLTLAQDTQRSPSAFRFAITRTDYFVTADHHTQTEVLRQVEMNTIAASYVGLAGRMADFHQTWRQVCGATWNIIPNHPVKGVAAAFEPVMQAYGMNNAGVLFVVQAGERNVFDQRILEIALSERGIPVNRASLEMIGEQGSLRDGHLVLNGQIMAITYFRAGYRPDELISETARRGRELIAHSSAISVPDLPTHLAGTKKIQQVLTSPQLLREFLDETNAALLESSFARIVTLDEAIEWEGKELLACEAAITQPEKFVLKPQREGGGFNLYNDDLRQKLQTMDSNERPAYILMERLYPITHHGQGLRENQLWQGEVVSEIGQFGVFFAQGDDIHLNEGVGYLVRTKQPHVNEGGISAGYGYLNSLAQFDATSEP